MTHTTHFIWVTSLLKPDTCKAIQWFSDYVSIFKVQSHTFSKCPLCSIAQAPAARHYLPIHSPFLDGEFAWMWLSRLNCIYVWNVLTISAVWFLLRTALCRAVIPSFVLKSRCAPPLFSTLMSSAQLSSCAASVRGHSASTRKQRTLLKTQLISKHWHYCAFFPQNIHHLNRCIFFGTKLSVALHFQWLCSWITAFFSRDRHPPVCWLLPVGVKSAYSHVSLTSQLICYTTGHPALKSPLWLDKHLHIHEEISKESNPALPAMQKAYFRKSIYGHLWWRQKERNDKSRMEKNNHQQ